MHRSGWRIAAAHGLGGDGVEALQILIDLRVRSARLKRREERRLPQHLLLPEQEPREDLRSRRLDLLGRRRLEAQPLHLLEDRRFDAREARRPELSLRDEDPDIGNGIVVGADPPRQIGTHRPPVQAGRLAAPKHGA